jgi:hypothetical protein
MFGKHIPLVGLISKERTLIYREAWVYMFICIAVVLFNLLVNHYLLILTNNMKKPKNTTNKATHGIHRIFLRY